MPLIEKDPMVDGFTMEPNKRGYKILHLKQEVGSVSFINQEDMSSDDMETAQDSPNKYKINLYDIKHEDKIKLYIKKIINLGFENIFQE